MKRELNSETIESVLTKISGQNTPNLKIISFTELYSRLNRKEINFIKEFLKINPRKYGFKGEFIGMEEMPRNLVTVKNQKYCPKNGKKKYISDQYLPLEVWLAYWGMNQALHRETGKKLLFSSGYRSPAYQTIVFLRCLKKNKFDFLRTMTGVALPGYSEHGDLVRQAVDFITIDGIPKDDGLGFEKTEEYKWLSRNAHKFDFYMSYPKDNKDGIIFEPWHWRYEK